MAWEEFSHSLGQSRRFDRLPPTSGLPLETDIFNGPVTVDAGGKASDVVLDEDQRYRVVRALWRRIAVS